MVSRDTRARSLASAASDAAVHLRAPWTVGVTRKRGGHEQDTPLGAWSILLAGGFVGALCGGLFGLVEIWLTASSMRSLRTFGELFGYAILIDAVLGSLLGIGLTLASLWLLRIWRSECPPSWALVASATLVPLVAGGLVLFFWHPAAGGESARPETAAGPLVGVCLALATVIGVALAWAARSPRHVRLIGLRIVPLLLLLLLVGAGVGVVRDLGAHGIASDEPSAPLAAAPRTVAPPGAVPSAPATLVPANALYGPPADAQDPSRAPGVAATTEPQPSEAGRAETTDPTTAVAPGRPNVLLITIDSLRADHLGAYGYTRGSTPTLDQLAADGVLFSRHYTSRNGTTPAHASIFTGAYPARHGIRSHMFDLLSPNVVTLAETFSTGGYTTAGLYSWLAFEPPYSGLERGFQTYTDLTVNLPAYLSDRRTSALAATYKRLKTVLLVPGAIDRQMAFSADIEETLDGKADVTTDAALLWLREYQDSVSASGQPFFLWIHYWDPHYPYTPPPPFDPGPSAECPDCPDGSLPTIRRIQWGDWLEPVQAANLMRYYDGEISFTDHEIGRLLDGLAGQGLDQSTLVVVMGDHGEGFGENCWLHGWDLLEPEIRVPLIVRFPDRAFAGQRFDAVASNTDVMPTLLQYAGVETPSTVEGRSLLPLVTGAESGADRYAVAELADRSIVTLVTSEWQLLIGPYENLRLFATSPAGHGLEDYAASRPDLVTELGRRLGGWQAEHP